MLGVYSSVNGRVDSFLNHLEYIFHKVVPHKQKCFFLLGDVNINLHHQSSNTDLYLKFMAALHLFQCIIYLLDFRTCSIPLF